MKRRKNKLGGLSLLGASLALLASANGQVSITTADGTNGADSTIHNDGNRDANSNRGGNGLEPRYAPGSRMKQAILRFDISALSPSSDNSGATISLAQFPGGGSRNRVWRVYGLRDGHSETVFDPRDDPNNTGNPIGDITVDEFWGEGTITYNTTPGILDSDADPTNGKGLNNAADILPLLDIYNGTTNPSGAWELVGDVADTPGDIGGTGYPITNNGVPTPMPLIDLGPFIDADTNGYVTFLVFPLGTLDNVFYIASKEDGTTPEMYPTLILPNGSAGDDDGDGLPNDWEIANMLDPNDDGSTDPNNGASGNPDGDAFTNLQEFQADPQSDPQNILSVPGDVDADGLADTWEDANFGDNNGTVELSDLVAQDGTGDPDNDKGTNEDEETAGTDPRIVNELAEVVDGRASFLDDDGGAPDGLNDWWEIAYFGDTAMATSPGGDNDGDGFTNQDEYAGFSNPNNIDSIPGDIDGDDVPDVWESRWYGASLAVVDDSAAGLAELAFTDGTTDVDLDGLTDLQESIGMPVGSDPGDLASIPGDMDVDGLGDQWELDNFKEFGTTLTDEQVLRAQNGVQDPDGDLYNNEEEETAGTDPNDFDSFVDVDNGGGGDGMNDKWEILYFGSTDVSDDPDADPDGDESSNYDEYQDGSDPSNIKSVFGDIDGDELQDDWELTYYESIWDVSPGDDTDCDYSNSADEQANGTSPIDNMDSFDSDGDSLGDGWEIFSFGSISPGEGGTDDPGSRDAGTNAIISGDPDGDGFINSEEYAARSSANDPISTPDTDNDRLPDGWELAHFIEDGEDPVADSVAILARQSANDDYDADGAVNLLELRLGTDPAGPEVPSPALLATNNLNGADIDLANDTQNAGTGPTVMNGLANGMALRYWDTVRVHIPMVRFDVSNLSGDLTGTMLKLNTTFGPIATANVYALVDGADGEDWDEATTSYSTAPAITAGNELTISTWSRDARKMRFIGTIALAPGGIALSNPQWLDLKSIIEADTDGLITLAFRTQATGNWWGISTKEDGEAIAPALVVPNGTVEPLPDGGPSITTVALGGGNLTMTVEGLSIGSQYHVESMTPPAAVFSAEAGSTFTAASDPQDVPIAADADAVPTKLFRIQDGAEPAP